MNSNLSKIFAGEYRMFTAAGEYVIRKEEGAGHGDRVWTVLDPEEREVISREFRLRDTVTVVERHAATNPNRMTPLEMLAEIDAHNARTTHPTLKVGDRVHFRTGANMWTVRVAKMYDTGAFVSIESDGGRRRHLSTPAEIESLVIGEYVEADDESAYVPARSIERLADEAPATTVAEPRISATQLDALRRIAARGTLAEIHIAPNTVKSLARRGLLSYSIEVGWYVLTDTGRALIDTDGARPVEPPTPEAAASLAADALPRYEIRRLDRGTHRFGLYRNETLVDAFAKRSNAESMLAVIRNETAEGVEGPRSRTYGTARVVWDAEAGRYARVRTMAERAESLADVVRERTRAAAVEPSPVTEAIAAGRALFDETAIRLDQSRTTLALRRLLDALDAAGIS